MTKAQIWQDILKRVKVRPNGCWEWQRGKSWGYGVIFRNGRGKTYRTHRVALEVRIGKSLGSLLALQRCDNRSCCNPAHLFPGTQQDNMDDAKAKGRLSGWSFPGERNPSAKL